MHPRSPAFGAALVCALHGAAARADTLTVGSGKSYAAPCAAIAAAHDEDVIEIDAAGAYAGDVCAIAKNGLTLRGVGGRAVLDAKGKNSGGKGIWVITGNDTTVENIEFMGATVSDKNGAGIRLEGENLTVRGCSFHDNENGILAGVSANSRVLVEFSEFARNGFGDGYSHNLYIGAVQRFTLRYSYSHDAKVGHLVKSRAAENYILYNRLSGESGRSSYEIDLPNAGTSVVLGNLIEQGPSRENPTLLAYGLEGAIPEHPGHDLYVVNNTFVNDRSGGGTFVNIAASIDSAALLQNNAFVGAGTVTNQANAVLTSNYAGAAAQFIDPAQFDYHPSATSPLVNAGTPPGKAGSFSLTPEWQYAHPASARARVSQGAIDIGGYERDGESDTRPTGASGAAGGAGAPSTGGAPASGGAAAGTPGAAGVSPSSGSPGVAAGRGGAGEGEAGATGSASSGCACRAASSNAERTHPRGWLCLLVAGSVLGRRRRRVRTRARSL